MTGVRIINRGNGVETALAAELVTDAGSWLPTGGGDVGERIEIRRVVIG